MSNVIRRFDVSNIIIKNKYRWMSKLLKELSLHTIKNKSLKTCRSCVLYYYNLKKYTQSFDFFKFRVFKGRHAL